MKLVLAAMLLMMGACKKSESTPAKPADPAPTATERGGTSGSGSGSDPTLPGGERRARMMKDLDTDNDGVISPEERAAGQKKRMERLRARLDTNGDGKLTPEELAAGTGRMKFDHPADIDANKDGDISADELEAAMTARRESRGSAAPGATE